MTIDTLRADHLGCYGYFRDTSPNIDALAAESILFERCIAPMATTLPTHTTLFTGVWPLEHGALANVEGDHERFASSTRLKRAAQVFEEAGYRTAAFVSALPLKQSFGLEAGFRTYEEPRTSQRVAVQTTNQALYWLKKEPDEPFFAWVHYFDPHSPYEPPRPYDERYTQEAGLESYLEPRGFAEFATRPTGQENELRSGMNAYDGEIRYTDEQLGRLLDHLRGLESWSSTIVLLLADHGEGLNQHMAPGHGLTWDEQLRVPCLLRLPGREAQRSESVISVADLLPTLFGQLRLGAARDFLEQASGVDVLADGFESRPVLSQSSERQESFGGATTYSLTGERWKSIVSEEGEERLYDLREDPYELVDCAAQNPDVMQELRERTWQTIRSMQARGESLEGGRLVPLSEEQSQGLRALGYVGDEEDD